MTLCDSCFGTKIKGIKSSGRPVGIIYFLKGHFEQSTPYLNACLLLYVGKKLEARVIKGRAQGLCIGAVDRWCCIYVTVISDDGVFVTLIRWSSF